MIHHGDLFDVLPTLDAESIDACVTDPPYGIGFMGKKWDTFSPSVAETKQGMRQINKSEAWSRKAKWVANPNLKGRTVNGAISSSQIQYDRSLLGQREFQVWTERWAREVFRVLKPGAHVLVCGAPRSYHRMGCGLEDAGFEIRDCIAWLFGQGFPKSLNFEDGWGTALKPANEPIVLARKPFKGTVGGNRAALGTGGLNIDCCRLETTPRETGNRIGEASADRSYSERGSTSFAMTPGPRGGDDLGRWPSNVLLDESAAAMLDEQSGELTSGELHDRYGSTPSTGDIYGAFKSRSNVQHADSGGASRFFYVAKPSRAERDRGCEDATPRQRDDSRKEGDPGGDNPRNRGLQARGNFHPTVKPVELMRYLVRLVTPVGGCVLDPFAGSGTTGIACAYEGFRFIGIEREAEYVEIARRRIATACPLFAEAGA